MEDQRSLRSGFFDVERHVGPRTLSPISLTAFACVAVLVAVIGWSIASNATVTSDPVQQATLAEIYAGNEQSAPFAENMLPSGTASSYNISDIGPQVVGTLAAQYAALQQKGAYTPEVGAAVATQLAPSLKAPVSYKTFSIIDISTVSDTSHARMEKYQSDLLAALAPLSQNTTPEISIFSAYTQTKDPKYLAELRAVAQYYTDATTASAKVIVPQDAIAQHIAILNAMGQFSATLKGLADNADDPIAVMALLSTYNDAELGMVISFNAFASYVTNHARS